MKKKLKNLNAILELQSFNPDLSVNVKATFGRKAIIEEGNGSGSWEGHSYSFEYSTCWRSGSLESNDYSIEDLIEILGNKWVQEMSDKDISLNLVETNDGDTDYKVEWEGEFTDDELDNRYSDSDCYWNGEIWDSEYTFSGIENLTITVTLLNGTDHIIVLNGEEKAEQERKEKEAEQFKIKRKKELEKQKARLKKEREKSKLKKEKEREKARLQKEKEKLKKAKLKK